jgi:hypothetical protein
VSCAFELILVKVFSVAFNMVTTAPKFEFRLNINCTPKNGGLWEVTGS